MMPLDVLVVNLRAARQSSRRSIIGRNTKQEGGQSKGEDERDIHTGRRGWMMYMTVEVKRRNVPEPSRRFPPYPIQACVGDVGYIRPVSISRGISGSSVHARLCRRTRARRAHNMSRGALSFFFSFLLPFRHRPLRMTRGDDQNVSS